MALAAGIAWAGPLLREGRWPEPGEAAIAAGLALLGARYVLGYRDTALAHRLEEGRRREAQEQALRDPLTGAANRRAFEERLGELSARASAGGSPFGLAFVDVDCFKEYNDAHGHAAGDDLLRELVAILRRESGPESMVARVGGDEFAVLVPSSDEGALAARVSRLRGVLWGHPRVRASVGGAVWRADVREARALLEAADRELYDAKRRKPGRPAVARAFDRIG
jgi:diguanylate cyclase (GGDEF)-like protein